MKIKIKRKNQFCAHHREDPSPVVESVKLVAKPQEFKIDTADAMMKYAGIVLDATVKTFIQKGKLDAVTHLIDAGGLIEVLRIDGRFLGSVAVKDALFTALGDVARDHHMFGLVVVADSWYLDHDHEQLRRIREDPKYFDAVNRACDQGGVLAAASAGFGTAAEAVLCTAQTRLFAATMVQRYRRDRGRIIPFGERELTDSRAGVGRIGGRMLSFYDDDCGDLQ